MRLYREGVPVPEIATRLVIRSGKNTGRNPSIATVYRLLVNETKHARRPLASAGH